MSKGVRAIVAAAALGVGLLGAAGVARADDAYRFTFTPLTGANFDTSGKLMTFGKIIISVNAIYII